MASLQFTVLAPTLAPEADRGGFYEELVELYRAAKASLLDVALNGRVVRSEVELHVDRADSSALIVHCMIGIDEHGLVLPTADGRSAGISAQMFVRSLQRARPALVYLVGLHSEDVARLVHEYLGSAVIFCSADADASARAAFSSAFYQKLLRDGEIKSAFAVAERVAASEHGPLPWRLLDGNLGRVDLGALDTDDSFLQLMEMGAMKPLFGRDAQLSQMARLLRVADELVSVVTGPPRSGVSTFIRAIAAQFGHDFERLPVHIDLKRTPGYEQVLTRIVEAFGCSRSALRQFIADSSVLICLDNFGGAADMATSVELIEFFLEIPRQSGSRVVIGWVAEEQVPEPLSQVVAMGQLSIAAAHDLLAAHVGAELATRAAPALRRLVRLPGRLMTLAEDLRNGATGVEVLDADDSRSGYGATLSSLESEDDTRSLLRASVLVEGSAPREVLRVVFEEEVRASNATRGSFDRAVAVMRSLGVLWVEESRGLPGATETYLTVDPDFLFAAQRLVLPSTNWPMKEADAALTHIAIAKAKAGEVTSQADFGWVTAALRAGARLATPHLVRDLGKELVAQKGPLRTLGTVADASDAFTLIIEAAEALPDPTLREWTALMVGERHYREGALDAASEYFELSLIDNPSPDTRLKASRALGQIEYRRGRFEAAVAHYQSALVLVTGVSSEYVATLKTQLGKAYVKIGRLAEASVLFHEAHDSCAKAGPSQRRGRLRAAHELARLEEAYGHDEVARSMYVAILAEAEADRFTLFTAGPLYQLGLLELKRFGRDPDALSRAIDYQKRCAAVAHDLRDALWMCLSMLLAGLIEFHGPAPENAEPLVVGALEMARMRGFGQAEQDGVEWLQTRQLPGVVVSRVATLNRLRTDSVYLALSEPKRAKAERYVVEDWRVEDVRVRFRSESDLRTISRTAGVTTCDCDLFEASGSCTHLATLRAMPLEFEPYRSDPEGTASP